MANTSEWFSEEWELPQRTINYIAERLALRDLESLDDMDEDAYQEWENSIFSCNALNMKIEGNKLRIWPDYGDLCIRDIVHDMQKCLIATQATNRLTLNVAVICDKPIPGGFGGYAIVFDAEKARTFNPSDTFDQF